MFGNIQRASIVASALLMFALPQISHGDDLHQALTFYASFDHGTDADFATGDAKIYTRVTRNPEKIEAGLRTDLTKVLEEEGRSGSALQFTKREAPWIFYQATENVSYTAKDWSGTVSFWLRLDPNKDLAPGYTDPIQLTPRGYNDAGLWVDFDKSSPRQFRLGAFPDLAIWNPEKRDVPESERPLFTVENPPFSRQSWTHVCFTWQGFNSSPESGVATFYLNGKRQGTITGWHQQHTWGEGDVPKLWLGLNYIGLFDELACFKRPLNDEEVLWVYQHDGSELLVK